MMLLPFYYKAYTDDSLFRFYASVIESGQLMTGCG